MLGGKNIKKDSWEPDNEITITYNKLEVNSLFIIVKKYSFVNDILP